MNVLIAYHSDLDNVVKDTAERLHRLLPDSTLYPIVPDTESHPSEPDTGLKYRLPDLSLYNVVYLGIDARQSIDAHVKKFFADLDFAGLVIIPFVVGNADYDADGIRAELAKLAPQATVRQPVPVPADTISSSLERLMLMAQN